MEMKMIIDQLEEQLKKEKLEAEDLEKKVCQWMAMLENAEEALKVKKDNVTSLEMMIEAAKEGHFGLSDKKSEPIVIVKAVKEITDAEVFEVAREAAPKFCALVKGIVARM